ncbi:MAG: phosphatidylserine/phosphatidylglycerophosphate/cardiolipin synthase family protein [Polyangiaceae bacterium]|nr:phosphatidylserine/phosphatidylglycerophosphate/cardiolipin synthase family protein [Myxococcales bacterium]MCB9586194.1 phosphatidylserine/phosphatidylglycerophosphate/cardiolipin synthase family protein [Polyangiaceae bacterium]MCB9606871.1 phosphatidylserine/phosphatidylglycerophosphate/cardiolipin synthase family protein [Polyangiaceae bacterium]
MNYRRVLVLVDLTAHPAPTFDALASLGSDIESLLLVFKGELESLEAVGEWHDRAAKLAAEVTLHRTRELEGASLFELAQASRVDLLVAGALSFESARLLSETGKQLDVAVLWPSEAGARDCVRHAFCIAIGERTRFALMRFLREHADASLQVSVAGPPASTSADLTDVLRASGVEAHVELIPRRKSVSAALEAARGGESVDLIVLARLPALMLVSYSWPAPVLLVPAASVDPPGHRLLDVTDVVEMDGVLDARIEEVLVGDVLSTLVERQVAFAARGEAKVVRSTSADGEVRLPAAFEHATQVTAWVDDQGPPDVLAAADQRFRVIRPDATRWTLFDAELPSERLAEVPTPGTSPLAVRLRPTRRASHIRERLRAAGIDAPVVDARAVLDEGPAYDVGEANDPVRLQRVAARMKSAGYRVALFGAKGAPPGHALHAELIQGNRVELEFDNAMARRWLVEGIERAERSVNLQTYIVADDYVGQAVEQALVAAGERGVRVRVLVDSLHGLHGSFGVENTLLTRLANHQGISLRVSRPVPSMPSMADLKCRDHRKLVILDGRVALIGGRNLAHEYYTGFDEIEIGPSTSWRLLPWLDAGARVQGPAVQAIEDSFVSAWVRAGGSGFVTQPPDPVGDTALRVVVHRGLEDAHTLDAYIELIRSARSHIYLVNGFPLLLELQHVLLRALQRGVRVCVLSGHPKPMYDGKPFPGPWEAARNTATEVAHSRLDPLVRAGGEVHYCAKRGVPGWDATLGVVLPHVHAKVLSVDGARCVVGSANFDVTASYWESELMVIVEDQALASDYEGAIQALCDEGVRVNARDLSWSGRAERRRWMRRWPAMLLP